MENDFFRTLGIVQYKPLSEYTYYDAQFMENYNLQPYESVYISTLFHGLDNCIQYIKNHRGAIYVIISKNEIYKISSLLYKITGLFTTSKSTQLILTNKNIKCQYINDINLACEINSPKTEIFQLTDIIISNTKLISELWMDDIIISFTVVPPKFLNDAFENTLDSIFNGYVQPKYVIINIEKSHKREFVYSIEKFNEKINMLDKKYKSLIFNYSESYGPMTKILGLHDCDFDKYNISNNSLVIVIDDDVIVHKYIILCYLIGYYLYNPNWICCSNMEINNNSDIIINNKYSESVFGVNSFAIPIKYIYPLKEFYDTCMSYDGEIWKNDDSTLTHFAKYFNLDVCSINMSLTKSILDLCTKDSLTLEIGCTKQNIHKYLDTIFRDKQSPINHDYRFNKQSLFIDEKDFKYNFLQINDAQYIITVIMKTMVSSIMLKIGNFEQVYQIPNFKNSTCFSFITSV